MNVEKSNILIVEDDKKFIEELKSMLKDVSVKVNFDEGYSEGDYFDLYEPYKYNLIILDLRLRSGYEGMGLLEDALKRDPNAPIIVITGYSSVATAVRSLSQGAKYYFEKSEFKENRNKFESNLLKITKKIIREDIVRKVAENQIQNSISSFPYLGSDQKMKNVLEFAGMFAQKKISPVLIYGEYGTETDIIAEFIYRESDMKGKFIRCHVSGEEGDLSSALHGKSTLDKMVKSAEKGVLYISDIFKLNKKNKESLVDIMNKAESDLDKFNVLFIFSTSYIPDPLSIKSTLDKDFFYLVKPPAFIELPPLRDRGEDTAEISNYYLSVLRSRGKVNVSGFTAEAIAKLLNYAWPDNLYELKQVVESAAIKATGDKSREIEEKHIVFSSKEFVDKDGLDLGKVLSKKTLEYLGIALERSKWKITKAYELLGYKSTQRGTLKNRITKIFINYPEFKKNYFKIYNIINK